MGAAVLGDDARSAKRGAGTAPRIGADPEARAQGPQVLHPWSAARHVTYPRGGRYGLEAARGAGPLRRRRVPLRLEVRQGRGCGRQTDQADGAEAARGRGCVHAGRSGGAVRRQGPGPAARARLGPVAAAGMGGRARPAGEHAADARRGGGAGARPLAQARVRDGAERAAGGPGGAARLGLAPARRHRARRAHRRRQQQRARGRPQVHHGHVRRPLQPRRVEPAAAEHADDPARGRARAPGRVHHAPRLPERRAAARGQARARAGGRGAPLRLDAVPPRGPEVARA